MALAVARARDGARLRRSALAAPVRVADPAESRCRGPPRATLLLVEVLDEGAHFAGRGLAVWCGVLWGLGTYCGGDLGWVEVKVEVEFEMGRAGLVAVMVVGG